MDLGITFDRSLTFQTHIEKVTCKALKLLGFVKRISAEFKLSISLKTLYCSFVWPVLEYDKLFVIRAYLMVAINLKKFNVNF
jgi:hypothetical protein